jgi:DNA-binding transcriptional MerR regulator
MTATMMNIGDFSRATHLTIKTLRHYHRVGLLAPAEIDASTGYRRYRVDQIPQALIISRFRGLDMPLDSIREVLTAPDLQARNAAISAHLERLEGALTHTRAAAASLRQLLTGSEPSAAPIEQLRVPATSAAAITATITTGHDTMAWLLGALAELHATLQAQGLQEAGPAAGIFADEVFTDGRGNATIFVPCSGSVAPVGRVQPVIVPAAELATILHLGSHADVDRAYGALAAFVAEHALAVPGPLREYYLTDLTSTPDQAQWRTRIGWPIFQTKL